MSRVRVPGSLLRFGLAAAVTIGLGLAVVTASTYLGGIGAHASTRPTIEPSAGYVIEYSSDTHARSGLAVGSHGEGCEALAASALLARVCVLATNLNPAVIAGEAFGRLNVEYGAPFEAIVWRARLDGRRDVCDRAGLLRALLDRCHADVGLPVYTVSDSGVTVVVPGAASAS